MTCFLMCIYKQEDNAQVMAEMFEGTIKTNKKERDDAFWNTNTQTEKQVR